MFFTNNDNLDTISEVSGDIAVRKEDTARLYRTYNFAYRPKSNLPILSMRNKVVSMIASNSVVIIRGSTGCGKTTQVPQLILDAEFEKKQHCNIIGIFCSNLDCILHLSNKILILSAFYRCNTKLLKNFCIL